MRADVGLEVLRIPKLPEKRLDLSRLFCHNEKKPTNFNGKTRDGCLRRLLRSTSKPKYKNSPVDKLAGFAHLGPFSSTIG